MCEKTPFERGSQIAATAHPRFRPLRSEKALEDIMDTVLFTDHGVVVFAITTSAVALMFSVLGLATTRRMRSDIEHQFDTERQLRGLR